MKKLILLTLSLAFLLGITFQATENASITIANNTVEAQRPIIILPGITPKDCSTIRVGELITYLVCDDGRIGGIITRTDYACANNGIKGTCQEGATVSIRECGGKNRFEDNRVSSSCRSEF